jgi:transposase
MNYKVTVTYKAIFQATKCKVRGYVRSETMPRVLFLIAGKINFSRFNEHAR